jgi:hypothetical protein
MRAREGRMNARELLNLLENSARNAEKKGTKAVAIENIHEAHAIALRMIEDDEKRGIPEDREARLAKFKAELDQWVDSSRQRHEHSIEMFRSVLSSAEQALKACMLINGGAAVALLAFSGNLIQHNRTSLLPGVSDALAWFVGGVLAGAMAFAFRYFSQDAFSNDRDKFAGVMRALCIVSGIAGLAAFIAGGYIAYATIGAVR